MTVTATQAGLDWAPGRPRCDLQVCDAIRWLEEQPAESVDLIVTDPAYESLEKHRAKGTTTRLTDSKASSNEWFPVFPNDRFALWFCHAYRVLRPDRHAYVMCDVETMFLLQPIAVEVGFTLRNVLVWDKKTIGMGYGYRRRHEVILYLEKGKRRLNDLGIPDVLEFPRVRDGYPTEKPVELCQVLVEQSTQPDELVVDTFFGSGAVAVAALQAGRRFAGCDVSQKAMAVASHRTAALLYP